MIPVGEVAGSWTLYPVCSSVGLSAPYFLPIHIWVENQTAGRHQKSQQIKNAGGFRFCPLLVHSVRAQWLWVCSQYVCWVSETSEYDNSVCLLILEFWKESEDDNVKMFKTGSSTLIQVAGCSSRFKGAGVPSFRIEDLRFGMAGWDGCQESGKLRMQGNSEKE